SIEIRAGRVVYMPPRSDTLQMQHAMALRAQAFDSDMVRPPVRIEVPSIVQAEPPCFQTEHRRACPDAAVVAGELEALQSVHVAPAPEKQERLHDWTRDELLRRSMLKLLLLGYSRLRSSPPARAHARWRRECDPRVPR